MLALIYTVPAKFIAWFADRELSWGGAWRMSSAALLPGAIAHGCGHFLYGWQAVDLIGLAFFSWRTCSGWVYLAGGVLGMSTALSECSQAEPVHCLILAYLFRGSALICVFDGGTALA